MSAHRTDRTRLTIARRAALLTVGTATAIGLSAGLTGTASALTPPPQPDLPIVQAPWDPQPPVVIDDLVLPTDQPDPEGPDDLVAPPTIPGPDPVPPQHPGDLTIGEDDGPQWPGPDDLTDGEDDGGGIPEGPDDLTTGDPEPTDHPDPTVPETTVPDPTVPEATEPMASP